LSLRSLIGIPKIPKTRQKKAKNALEAIPQKKPDKIEYVCKVFFKYDTSLKKQFYVFAIETVAEFTSFAYEVSVEAVKEKNTITFFLMGLRALTNMAPKIQPARSEVPFEDLIGDYTINLVKPDGAINQATYHFNIFLKEIKLLESVKLPKKNNRWFVRFEVAENEFTFKIK
jgi:hypothetical protein